MEHNTSVMNVPSIDALFNEINEVLRKSVFEKSGFPENSSLCRYSRCKVRLSCMYAYLMYVNGNGAAVLGQDDETLFSITVSAGGCDSFDRRLFHPHYASLPKVVASCFQRLVPQANPVD